MNMNDLPEGTEIIARIPDLITASGIIRGFASSHPDIGKMYIVEITKYLVHDKKDTSARLPPDYPYSCMVIPQSCLTLADSTENWQPNTWQTEDMSAHDEGC